MPKYFIHQYLLKLLFVVFLIFIGLISKSNLFPQNGFISNYAGGIIYVVFFIVLSSLFFTETSPIKISVIVLVITSLIEFTQLIQNEVLIGIRDIKLIRALIGSTFNPFDFLFYLFGMIIGCSVLMILKSKK